MQPFICSRCGAVQTLPAELTAIAVRCPFCGQENPIPAEARSLRSEQARMLADSEARAREVTAVQASQRTVSRTILIVVALVIVLPILGSLAFVLVAVRAAPSIPTPPSPPVVVAATAVEVAKPKPPPDARTTGSEQTTARLKNLYQLGCKNVILPPAEAVGERTLKADFVVNGTCVRVLVITGAPDNKLSLAMKTPFGEKIATPAPSTEVDFTYCPKTAGPHPTTITPAIEDDPYTVAAVECPASMNKK